ncbi:hypothetical protein IGI37_003831 [Enterococcus sp. AZ194]|uniref:GNAT family N-acetyltransferase n=1 Tax=Enterococcus sp. AZ194 TaxID=2774629 RepID=UPI003F1FA4F2
MVKRIDKNLVLEEVSIKDFKFMKRMYQDMDFQTVALTEENFEIQDDNISRTIDYFRNTDNLMFIIKYKGVSVGFTMFYDYDSLNKKTKFGIALEKKYQDNIIAMRVFTKMQKIAFEELNLKQMSSEVIDINIKMLSIIRRLDYFLEDIKVNAVKKGENYYNLNLFTTINKGYINL